MQILFNNDDVIKKEVAGIISTCKRILKFEAAMHRINGKIYAHFFPTFEKEDSDFFVRFLEVTALCDLLNMKIFKDKFR